GAPVAPFLVVIKMIPFEPRTPYGAVEIASFRKLMVCTSEGSKYAKDSRSTPSIMISGEALPYVDIPRIRKVALSAPGLPDCCNVVNPGTLSGNSVGWFMAAAFSSSSPRICATEPTTFRLAWVPQATAAPSAHSADDGAIPKLSSLASRSNRKTG